MNIVHFILGVPPFRSGGLTGYAIDLINEQNRNPENKITVLYPTCTYFPLKGEICRKESYNGIDAYSVKTNIPIPLLYGIKNPARFLNYKPIKNNSLENFYYKVQPEILHVHTLMGLPIELITFLKNKGTKIVYTSHDYFGLCPKVNFIDNDGNLCCEPSGANCAKCNIGTKGWQYLYFRNYEPLINLLKNIKQHKFTKRNG